LNRRINYLICRTDVTTDTADCEVKLEGLGKISSYQNDDVDDDEYDDDDDDDVDVMMMMIYDDDDDDDDATADVLHWQ